MGRYYTHFQFINVVFILIYVEIQLYQQLTTQKKDIVIQFHQNLAPLTLAAMLLEFPCLLLQQFMTDQLYIVTSILKIILMLIYVIDTVRYRPLHSRLNVFFLVCSTILLFNSLLFFFQYLIQIQEEALLYASLIMSPLIAHVSVMIFENSQIHNREEEILYWIDELHVMENELKKDNSFQIKWLCIIKTHHRVCTNNNCLSHLKLNIANLQKVKEITNSVVVCTIEQFIRKEEQKLLKNRKLLEGIYLQLITYLSNECFTPLKAYIQLKTFEAKQESTTTFFQIMSEYLNDKLEFKTKQFQDLKYIITVKDNDFEKLDIKEIRASETLWSSIYPKIIKVVDQKIIFWEKLITGYPKIEDFLGEAVKLSYVIWDVKKLIFSRIKVDPLNINKSLQHLNGIQLRILSIVYSAVLNDFYGTMDIEGRLDEILQFERNLYWDIILNTTLLNESVVVIMISIIKNKGLILNKNRSTLARFFGYDSLMDFNAVQLITDLQPEFMQSRHNTLIDNYIQRGYSKFFSTSQIVFFKDKLGFIHCAHLKLANLFDTSNDYIINGSLLKIKMNYNFLLFDQCGKILGLSQEVYEILVGDDMKEITPAQINQKYFVFFWLSQICDSLSDDLQDLQKQENDHTSQVRTVVLQLPKNLSQYAKDFDRFCLSNQLRDTFYHSDGFDARKLSSRGGSFKEIRTKTLGSEMTQQHQVEDETEDPDNPQDKILGFPIALLNPKIKKKLYLFKEWHQTLVNQMTIGTGIETKTLTQSTNMINLKYSIQFSTIGEKEKGFCFFICHIHEIRKQDQNYTSQRLYSTMQANNSTIVSEQVVVQQPNIEQTVSVFESVNSEKSIQFNFNETVINKLAVDMDISSQSSIQKKQQQPQSLKIMDKLQNFDKTIDDISNVSDSKQFHVVDHSKDISQFLSPRNPKEQLIQQEIVEIDQDMEDDDQVKDSSQKDGLKAQRDIVAVFVENRHNNKQLQVGEPHQSISSTTSNKTQNSIFNLLKILQYKNSFPINLVQIFLINLFVSLVFLILVIIKVNLVGDNLTILQSQLTLVRSPNQFNQMFCHFTVYQQLQFLDLFNITDFNSYERLRLTNSSAVSRKMLSPILAQVKAQFAIFQQRNQLSELKMLRVDGEYVEQTSATFFVFIFYFNQEAFQLNKLIVLNPINFTQRQLDRTYTLKLNIYEEMKLTQSLLDTVYISFQSSLYGNDQLYIILLCVGLGIFAILIPLQIPFWKSHFLYKQRILLLISRVQQKDAEVTLDKLQQTKNFLADDNNKWKQMNYHQFYFLDAYDNKKNVNVKAKIKKLTQSIVRDNRSTLTSRIQEPRFSYFRIYISILVQVIIIQLSLMAMYLYSTSVNQSTRPQLSLSMSFIRFKQDYDNFNMLALIIKTEPLLESAVNKSTFESDVVGLQTLLQVQQVQLVTKFSSLYFSVYSQFQSIYDNIVQSQKIDNTRKSLLLSLYQNDLCGSLGSSLPFCSYNNSKFTQFPLFPSPENKDNYRNQLNYGMTGLIEGLRQTISTNYEYELQNLQYDTNLTRIVNYTQSKEYITLIQNYFIDLYQPFTIFESSISSAALSMLQSDFMNIGIFHYVLCIILIVMGQIYIIVQLQKALLKVKAARQALVNMPFVMLLDPQTISQLKRLDQD